MSKKRFDDNMSILIALTKYIGDNPDQRFGQALKNLGIVIMKQSIPNDGGSSYNYWVDEYNTEPEVILKRMKE